MVENYRKKSNDAEENDELRLIEIEATTYQRKLDDFHQLLKQVRYTLIRFLALPLPCLKYEIPIIGGRTAIELLSISLALTLVILLVQSDPKEEGGKCNDIIFAIVILISLRHNILSLIFGISYQSALFWHKALAVIGLISVSIHMTNGINNSGLALIILFCLMTALYLVKDIHFETFYYTHILCFLLTVVFGLLHGASYFPYAIIVWCVDLVLRFLIRGKVVNAQVTVLPGNVVEMKFPRQFKYSAGQYCFVRTGEVNLVEYHPFSISSEPGSEVTSFHVKASGDWTKKLQGLIESGKKEMSLFLEGPYGQLTVDIETNLYSVIVMVAGGIGVTPMRSLYLHLQRQQANGRPLRKVIFIWTTRDNKEAIENTTISNRHLPLSFQPDMKPAEPVLHNYSSPLSNKNNVNTTKQQVPKDDKKYVEMVPSKDIEMDKIPSDADLHSISSQCVFCEQFYLTAPRSEEEFKSAGITPGASGLCLGRPDLPAVFQEVRELCVKEGVGRVAVFTCGPGRLVGEVDDLSKSTNLECGSNVVRFDCHTETFAF